MKKIMILGVTGLIGRELVDELSDRYKLIGLSRGEMTVPYEHVVFDLEQDLISPILSKYKPDIIISCVRGDFVKQFETHEEIVRYAKDNKATVHFYSTANVFDGDAKEIKYEESITKSESDYGLYKIKCESLVLSLGEFGTVLRLPMVFARTSPRMKQIESALQERKKMDIYDQCYLSIVLSEDVAKLHGKIIDNNESGIFHLAAKGVMSQEEIYTKIMGSAELLNVLPLEVYYLAIQSNRAFINELNIETTITHLSEYIRKEHHG